MHNPELETTRPRLGLSATQLILAVSTFLLLTGNFTFFKQVLQVYPWNGANAGFLLSVVVVLACEIVLLIALVSLVVPTRVTVSVLLLVAAVTAYFADSFGTIVDQAMMLNVAQASPAETADLINARLL